MTPTDRFVEAMRRLFTAEICACSGRSCKHTSCADYRQAIEAFADSLFDSFLHSNLTASEVIMRQQSHRVTLLKRIME
ncbi:hypothetical protein LCGC14_3088940 [marine sediment metagenome]|uniref:Uncharacterized protein n=1 Tax=marine sediment metagenome TaxID=412755 RepID=A0A0F8Z1M1_9ZZZZ